MGPAMLSTRLSGLTVTIVSPTPPRSNRCPPSHEGRARNGGRGPLARLGEKTDGLGNREGPRRGKDRDLRCAVIGRRLRFYALFLHFQGARSGFYTNISAIRGQKCAGTVLSGTFNQSR